MSGAPARRPMHGRTWVVGVLALTTLLIAGGAAQSATGDSRAAKRAAVVHTYQLDGRQLAATGGTVTLFVHVKKNSAGKFVPKYIGAMFASGHHLNCDEGQLPERRQFSTQNDVGISSAGKFQYVFRGFKAKFTGTVFRHGRKAVGTVSYGPNDVVDTTTGTTYHNCVLPNPVKYTANYTKTTE
jgi:hypothetical protein